MDAPSGPVYEVTLDIDPDIAAEFDAWLAGHVEDMLALPGFVSARTYTDADSAGERVRRITQYRLDSERSLDDYLEHHATTQRQAAVQRFGDRFSASRRILRVRHGGDESECLNCGAALAGQYCGRCGQRARSRLISLWELLRDAFGDLFELDSRLWRTLIPLAARPGKLTADYLNGRRVSFMPPFRTYLVLSLVFFVLAFFDPQQEFKLLLDPAGAAADAAPPGDSTVVTGESDGETRFDCAELATEALQAPQWVSAERVERVCNAILADGARTLNERMIENLPPGLYLLLPLIAVYLKLLYPLSGRYYVEHLLFVVHFHAFLFLALMVQLLLTRIGDTLPTAADVIITLVVPLYIPVYLYKALRRVYRQRHLLTFPKYVILLAAYFLSFGMMLGLAALVAVLSL